MGRLDEIVSMLRDEANTSVVAFRHAAAIVRGKQIISVGVNKYLNEFTMYGATVFITAHAEIDAVFKARGEKIKGADMIIIRVGGGGVLKNSRPCNGCIDKMRQQGIRRVYYSTDDGKIESEYVDEMPKFHNCASYNFRVRNKCDIEV